MSAPLPADMLACIYRGRGQLSVEPHPTPTPGPDDVLLRVSHCGVCGTDLHLVMDGWGRPDSIGGHEYSGEIVALGDNVSDFAVGDRVVGGPEPGCGECRFCLAHRPNLCTRQPDLGASEFQGAFAEFKKVPASQILRIPDGLSLREAALCEPLAVALHGITRSRIADDARALVIGAGPIGALTIAVLHARGIREIVVSEPSTVRRALAEKLGASRLVAPDELVIPPLPTQLVDEPVDCVYECSGRAEALEAGLAQLAKTGTLVIQGTGTKRPKLDSIRVLLNELVVTGAFNYDENGFADAIEWLASGRLPTDLLIESQDVGLHSLFDAMQDLVGGRVAGKVMVSPSAQES